MSGVIPLARHQYSTNAARRTAGVSDMKLHSENALALPDSPQSVGLSLQAAKQQSSATAVLSHSLDFSDSAEDASDQEQNSNFE